MANITRLSIPLTKETRRQLQALADVQSSSLAAVCSELLDSCAPEVYEMAQALKLAKQSPAAAQRRMASVLEEKMAQLDQFSMDFKPKPRKRKTG